MSPTLRSPNLRSYRCFHTQLRQLMDLYDFFCGNQEWHLLNHQSHTSSRNAHKEVMIFRFRHAWWLFSQCLEAEHLSETFNQHVGCEKAKVWCFTMFSQHDILLMEEILHQLIGSLSHYLQGFIHINWCRISSINSIIYYCIYIGCFLPIFSLVIQFPCCKGSKRKL